MSTAIVGRFSVGGTISHAFSILSQNIIPFGIIALVVTLPSFVYEVVTGTSAVATNLQTSNGEFYATRSVVGSGALFAVLLELTLRQVAVGAISYGVFQEMRGQRASIADCFGRAVALAFPAIGVAVVASLATLVAAFLLIVPGLIVASMLWVAVPVAVVERPGVVASLARSAALTKGHRWQVFGLLLLTFILDVALSYVAGLIVIRIGSTFLTSLTTWIVDAFVTAVFAIATAVSYSTLRMEKEGVDVHAIAAVFD